MADSLDIKSRVPDRLGMTWGQFSAMCKDRYPDSRYPIQAYIDDPENHADISPPVPPPKHGDSRVVLIRRCRWCGAQIVGRPSSYHYCDLDCRAKMVSYKTAIYNRKGVLERAIARGTPREELAEEMAALEHGVRPGKGLEAHPPYLIQRLRDASSELSTWLLGCAERKEDADG